MVSVIHDDVDTVLDASLNSVGCSTEDTTRESETTSATTSPQASPSITVGT
ncbi:hypothetical protein GCK32_021115 [Trichostrongylus colubriformis]|uniref:Uncharacterized protein n=1 Tax=Trichostrongylus colubriformis TaxID=6319 RepID=A0AAN8IA64_TRICO